MNLDEAIKSCKTELDELIERRRNRVLYKVRTLDYEIDTLNGFLAGLRYARDLQEGSA